jgi:hypothetical protein
MNDEYERIKSKVNYFARNNMAVHISKKVSGWANGNIIMVTDDYLTLDEYEDGIQDIFLVDIKEITEFKPPIIRKMEKEDGRTRA